MYTQLFKYIIHFHVYSNSLAFLQTLQGEECWKLSASLNRMLLDVYIDDDDLISILEC